MNIKMSDYPELLAQLRKYFPKLIVRSYELDNANLEVSRVTSDVSKANMKVHYYNLLDGHGHILTPYRLRGKAQLSIFMSGMLVGLTWKEN